jgi:hypothetical protein
MTDEKKTGVSFECTQKQRESYIKAAGGKKLGVSKTLIFASFC